MIHPDIWEVLLECALSRTFEELGWVQNLWGTQARTLKQGPSKKNKTGLEIKKFSLAIFTSRFF